MKLSITKPSGGRGGQVDVSETAFGKEFNEALVHQVVNAYLAGRRVGSRAQKNRAAVRGGGAKPWKQKGTGRSRAGTIRSNIFRGGGRAFPATPHDFSQKVNRKMYRAAMRSILSELHRQERLVVISELQMPQPKTKALVTTLTSLHAVEALLVLSEDNTDIVENIALAARNLKHVSVCTARELDPLSLISHEKVVVTADALKKIDAALQ